MTLAPLSFTKTVKKKQRSFELPAPAAPLADTHAHLTCFWNKTPAEALARATRAGVRSLVTLWDPSQTTSIPFLHFAHGLPNSSPWRVSRRS